MRRRPGPLTLTLLGLCGCLADSAADGGTTEDPPRWPAALPELDRRCPDVEFPQFGPSPALSERVTLLPCDELWSGRQGGILYPDGELVLFEGAGTSSRRAPPSGDLLAPVGATPTDRLLIDVHARSSRPLGKVGGDGWVPSFGRPWGAWLWTCTDGVLQIHDPVRSLTLAKDVTCIRVKASEGAPMLVYDTGDTLHIANVDTQTIVEADTPPFRYQWNTPCSARLIADYDGRFASLQQVCRDTPEQGFLRVFSAVDGSRVVDEPAPWEAASISAREQGFVIYDGSSLRGLGPEGLHEIVTGVQWATVNSRLYAQRGTDDPWTCELLRGNAAGLESLGLGPCFDSVLARPDHDGIVVFREVGGHQLMQTWTSDAGWAWPEPIASERAEWHSAIMHSDGTTLAYESHPEGRVIVVSPVGEILGEWTGHGVALGDEHFIIRSEGVYEGLKWEAASIIDRSGQIVLQPVGELEAKWANIAGTQRGRVAAVGSYGGDVLAWYGIYP